MNVVICTGEQVHSKHLCVEIARHHNVVAILHPMRSGRRKLPFAGFRKKILVLGRSWAVMNELGRIGRRGLEKQLADGQRDAWAIMRPTVDEFKSLQSLCHLVPNFGAASTLRMLEQLSPQVIICLGGSIYPKQFIDSCPLVLNYHSG
jgi:hypothetical protein